MRVNNPGIWYLWTYSRNSISFVDLFFIHRLVTNDRTPAIQSQETRALIGRGREEPDNETEHLEYEIIIHLFKLGYYSTSSGFFFLVNVMRCNYPFVEPLINQRHVTATWRSSAT